uniref:Uncharacterized protein n=1 Tax=Timema tahoe TaxID=61484 RepID=A0A7R9ID75_9NEOP|nr:unnamed protein product [Timema tahoe]
MIFVYHHIIPKSRGRKVTGARNLPGSRPPSSSSDTMDDREKKILKEIIFERRALLACTCMVGISLVLWVASISTDYWFTVNGGQQGIYVNESKRFFLSSNSGLFRICRLAMANATATKGMTIDPKTNVTVTGKLAFFLRYDEWRDDSTGRSDSRTMALGCAVSTAQLCEEEGKIFID